LTQCFANKDGLVSDDIMEVIV